MLNVLKAIMDKTASSSLSSDVGGRIFNDYAPEGTEYPYIVTLNIPDVPVRYFCETFENYQIQFSLFSTSEGVTEIGTMYTDLKALFDEQQLTVGGAATFIWMKRLGTPATMVEDHTTPDGTAQVRHWAIDYNIMTQEAVPGG